MNRSIHKRFNLNGLFTDFKHHAKSWANSKKMRTKRERQRLKEELDECNCKGYEDAEELHTL